MNTGFRQFGAHSEVDWRSLAGGVREVAPTMFGVATAAAAGGHPCKSGAACQCGGACGGRTAPASRVDWPELDKSISDFLRAMSLSALVELIERLAAAELKPEQVAVVAGARFAGRLPNADAWAQSRAQEIAAQYGGGTVVRLTLPFAKTFASASAGGFSALGLSGFSLGLLAGLLLLIAICFGGVMTCGGPLANAFSFCRCKDPPPPSPPPPPNQPDPALYPVDIVLAGECPKGLDVGSKDSVCPGKAQENGVCYKMCQQGYKGDKAGHWFVLSDTPSGYTGPFGILCSKCGAQ